MILLLIACLAGGAVLVWRVIDSPVPDVAWEHPAGVAAPNRPERVPQADSEEQQAHAIAPEAEARAAAEPGPEAGSPPADSDEIAPSAVTTVNAAIAELSRIHAMDDFVARLDAEKALHDRLSEEWKGLDREFRVRISGRVIDGDELPVAGATIEIGGWISMRPEQHMLKHIRIIQPQGNPKVITDHAGYFEHEWVFKDSALTLEISLYYEAKVQDGRYSPQDELGPYRPGSHEARVECRVPARRPLTFVFSDRHGNAVKGITISLLAEAPVMDDFGMLHMRRHTLTTDDQGRVRFVGLNDDTYHLETPAPWRAPGAELTFRLTQSDLPSERAVTLTRDISYSVRFEATPALKAGATVHLVVRLRNGDTEHLAAQTGTDGVAQFWGLSPDAEAVRVSVPGYKECAWQDVRLNPESDHDGGTVPLYAKD